MGRIKNAPERFTNGRLEYIEMDDSYIQYGNDGLFARIDFGVSLSRVLIVLTPSFCEESLLHSS